MNKIKLSKPLLLILSISFLALTGTGIFWPFAPKTLTVIEVKDGDTIRLENQETIRLIGIDTPELGQGQTEDECYAEKAKKEAEALLLGKKVRLELDQNKMDHFGRTLAYVYLDNLFVNEKLLQQGTGKYFMDTVNTKYSSLFIAAADQAHGQKTGLWQECAPDPKLGCQIKGNIDRLDHRWYHLASFRHYQQTDVNLKNGDQWFCTEAEAIKAGFEKARE